MFPSALLKLGVVFASSVVLGIGADAAAVTSNKTPQFTTAALNLVKQRLAESAVHSWEIGTRATALLEYEWPNAFVYSSLRTIPPRLTEKTGDLSDVFEIVDQVLASRPPDILPFFNDTAAGDPASVGIPFLIRDWTDPNKKNASAYSTAIDDQLYFLLDVDGRTPEGAISHRAPPQPVQLWADFLSMAPPFIAYYGAVHNNASLLTEAYTQVRLYREALLDETGLLQHIVLGNDTQDYGHWATGNGWAVSGSLRILRTIQSSSFAHTAASIEQQKDLINWSSSLLKKIWTFQQPSGALLNYIDADPTVLSNSTFEESSGTTLLAACTFRLASIAPEKVDFATLAAAEKAREYIVGRIDADGWLTGVVNPLDWYSAGEHSPEGQAFVLMLAAAYRDWKAKYGIL